jgi:hypothetical protein
VIGGKGGRKIEALSPREWLEQRYREIKGLPRDGQGRLRSLGRKVSVSKDQIGLEDGVEAS